MALLIGIEYNARTSTLNSIEVENIEKKMFNQLKDMYNIVLK